MRTQSESNGTSPQAAAATPNLSGTTAPTNTAPTELSTEALKNHETRTTDWLEKILAENGYELVAIEFLHGRENAIQLFVDHLDPEKQIDLEDCVKVNQILDLPLESNPDIAEMFKSGYELEVSSPGIDRPLRKFSDYSRFEGERARIQTFRALNATEGENADYFAKNPKQKNFYGILRGKTENGKVILGAVADDGSAFVKAKPGKGKKPTPPKETKILIPHSLISKANLEREVKDPSKSDKKIVVLDNEGETVE